ncbi:MAG: hypothetical protein IJH67_04330 [Thermoguttaceae bacterium]|nr:hypothetical protein [Thermoguttaceae bacterium]
MNNQIDFDIFDFLGIEVTDNLATVQKALNDLPAKKMARLRKNPEFSKMRSFIFTKTATPAYLEYVQNIRNLRIKNKPQTNTNQNQRQNQTDMNQPHPEDNNILSDPDKQQEWIRKYDERVNELNRNRNNNSKDGSDEQRPIEQNTLQRLADLLNQKPDRKTSLVFTVAWFFNTKSFIELIIICFFMAILTSLFSGGLGISFLVKCLSLFLLGFAAYRLILLDFRSLNLIKTGYFTLGHKDSNGDILYTDKNNTQHRWCSKSFQLLNDSFYNEFLIVTDRSNPNQIKVLTVLDYKSSSSYIEFIIQEWFMFLDLPVTFNLSNSEFSSAKRFLWFLLATIVSLFIVCC